MKVAFVCDSGTGKNIEEMKEKGIYSLPLQISHGEHNQLDLVDITIQDIHTFLKEKVELKTSLPSVGMMNDLFMQLKSEGYDCIFAVPICSGLSGTIQAMKMTAESIGILFEYVDCHVTAVVEEYLIILAKKLYDEGKSIEEIKVVLEEVIASTNTLLMPDDLNHLKRGGRLTPLAATLGGLLKIKPILQINQKTSGKIDVLDKVRTLHRAMDKAIDYMRQEAIDENWEIVIAHVDSEEEASILQTKLKAVFPMASYQVIPLVSVVSVHTGLGCLGIQYFKHYQE